jgi:hypothetical protein
MSGSGPLEMGRDRFVAVVIPEPKDGQGQALSIRAP